MIKKENGSALLTVILIAFVTATIGAAISSFIMMNYKLRIIDKNIGIAEYEVETIQTYAYAEVVKTMAEIIEDADKIAKEYTNTAIEKAENLESGAYLDPELKDEEGVTVDVDDIINFADVSKPTKPGAEEMLKKGYFKQAFEDKMKKTDFSEVITAKLESKYGEINIAKSEREYEAYFEDRPKKIGLYFIKEEGTYNFTLKIYYKKENVRPVELSGKFIIQNFEYANEDEYDISKRYHILDKIGITNVEFIDWGI